MYSKCALSQEDRKWVSKLEAGPGRHWRGDDQARVTEAEQESI